MSASVRRAQDLADIALLLADEDDEATRSLARSVRELTEVVEHQAAELAAIREPVEK